MGRLSLKDSSVSFDLLLDALGALKRAGLDDEDEGRIWCLDWIWTFEDPDANTDAKARVAKSSLRRMKSIANVLASVSTSLENTIDLVAEQSLDIVRTSGLSSLPDDILARVFELYYEDYRNVVGECSHYSRGRSFPTSSILTQVNRGFRRIALHIPALWECIPGKTRHAKEMIGCIKERCQNPIIFLDYDFFKKKDILSGADLLRILPPASRWKGLDVSYGRETCGREFFEDIFAISGGTLDGLLDLRISHKGYLWRNNDNDGRDLSTNLSDSDASLLAQWSLPKLKRLFLMDVIPSKMNCPNLTECRVNLGVHDVAWNIRALKELFRCTPHLESLSFSFDSASSTEMGADDPMVIDLDEPVKLARLSSLAIHVGGMTEGAFLKAVMDSLDVSSASSLKISLRYETDTPASLEFYTTEWLTVIFNVALDRRRSFPNVKDFRLSLYEDRDEYLLPYAHLTRAIPQVRNIVFNVPGCREPPFREFFKHFGDLRSVRLVGCNSFSGGSLLDGLERLDRQKLEQIERFEIEGCQDIFEHKRWLEKWLGGKLVWKA
ncbi:hypothetical protein SCHPADRAFT_944807 [Schizopora paradoxa]|uniref:F-box domain-containing protein n=1 Tax=Schizopora paradoxa TaxID=27342 RepID=A0A0H2R880_9AGAM|nr:hypothetical protein SCHPADRAFT_944807 [Schizopora paradoxa]